MNKWIKYSFFAAILLVGSVFFVVNWNLLPRGVHAWAQSDRLAQAYGYFFNGFQLDKPILMTPCLCTGEFPILAYLIALSGKLFGLENIHVVYRLANIFLATLGWSTFAFAIYNKTRWWVGAFFAASLVFTSPFLVFFSQSYIQDAVSLAVLLVGASIFWRADKTLNRPAYLALLILTISALIKTTSATFLIATALTQLWLWRNVGFRKWLPYLVAFLVSLCLLVVHLTWMTNYNKTNGCGIFLSKPMPLKLGFNLINDLNEVYKANSWYLFSSVHKVLLIALSILSLLGLWLRYFPRWLALHFLLVLGGAFGFFWLMGQQFIIHTYYLLCSFVPVIAMLAGGGTITLHQIIIRKRFFNIALIALLMLTLVQSKAVFRHLDESLITDQWIIEAKIPDDFAVKAHEYILYVTASDAPNYPQVYFKRSGVIFQRDRVFANPDLLLEHHRLYASKYIVVGLEDAAKLMTDTPFAEQTKVLYRGNSFLLIGFK